jgi:hypothetical protein
VKAVLVSREKKSEGKRLTSDGFVDVFDGVGVEGSSGCLWFGHGSSEKYKDMHN